MAINNTVILTGNMGSEARLIETEANRFAAFSLATTDSYQDQDGNWQEKETLWHNIIAFSPTAIETVKHFKKGTRLKITGSLSYRPFEIYDADGEIFTKKEASIIIRQVEVAPLAKKKKAAETA